MPTTTSNLPNRYQFGDLTLEAGPRRVKRGQVSLDVGGLTFDLLLALVESAPNVVGHDELVNKVWRGRSTSPETITQRAMMLRQALSDDADHPQYFEAVRGQGYRLIPTPEPLIFQAPANGARWRLIGGSVAVVAFAVVLTAGWQYWRSAAPDSPASVAVLPFTNQSSAEENAEFFASGMHSEILTQLTKIASLKVISQASVLEYLNTRKNIREIGEELGVAAILEGNVQRSGDLVRINVVLIKVETGEHLWAESYDRELTVESIFSIQREMATSVADALQATLTPSEVARLSEVPTQNRRAYDFYLSGNEYYRRTLDQSAYELAMQQYERAVQEDPEFALAYARMARTHIRFYWLGYDRTESRRRRADQASLTALELAPNLPEAHLARGYYHYHGYRDYESALREFEIAGEGIPGNAELFEARAYVQRRLGQWEQSVETLNRAIELDPRNVYQLYSQSRTYMLLRDYAALDSILERILEISPDDANAYGRKVQVPLWRNGDTTLIKSAAEMPPMPIGLRQQLFGWTTAIYERDYAMALASLDSWGVEPYSEYDAYIPKSALYGVTHTLAGEPALAQPALQMARVHLEGLLDATPDDPRIYTALGEVLAASGESDTSVRLVRRAMELVPTSTDALDGPIHRLGAVRVLAWAGEHDAAIEELDAYLSAPGRWSIEGLMPDPRLDPIRDDPRFHALIDKYGQR